VAGDGIVGALPESAGELLRPQRQKEPAPILICLMVWAGVSALVWAGIALVIHLM
jgi:hypothetical protein